MNISFLDKSNRPTTFIPNSTNSAWGGSIVKPTGRSQLETENNQDTVKKLLGLTGTVLTA